MGNYSNEEDRVRVDFFKPSGKWYETESVKWTGPYSDCSIHEALAISLREHFRDSPRTFGDMDAVCLEPYHEHSHPIQIKAGGWIK